MAITNGNVGSGQTVDVLTVPAGKSYAITSVLITNTGTEDQQVDRTVDFIYML